MLMLTRCTKSLIRFWPPLCSTKYLPQAVERILHRLPRGLSQGFAPVMSLNVAGPSVWKPIDQIGIQNFFYIETTLCFSETRQNHLSLNFLWHLFCCWNRQAECLCIEQPCESNFSSRRDAHFIMAISEIGHDVFLFLVSATPCSSESLRPPLKSFLLPPTVPKFGKNMTEQIFPNRKPAE